MTGMLNCSSFRYPAWAKRFYECELLHQGTGKQRHTRPLFQSYSGKAASNRKYLCGIIGQNKMTGQIPVQYFIGNIFLGEWKGASFQNDSVWREKLERSFKIINRLFDKGLTIQDKINAISMTFRETLLILTGFSEFIRSTVYVCIILKKHVIWYKISKLFFLKKGGGGLLKVLEQS